MICRPKPETDPYYLLLFLRSNAGYQAIQDCIRGQSGHIYPKEVKTIKVPIIKQARELKRAIHALREGLESRRLSAESEGNAKRIADELFPAEGRKPVIAS
jgi:hypothetical protein